MTLKRTLCIAALTIVALIASPRPASAGFWAWLEEFSGPGKFHGSPFLANFCRVANEWMLSPIASDKKGVEPANRVWQGKLLSPCVYATYGEFSADPSPTKGFPHVSIALHEGGLALRLFDALDAGAGMGFATIRAEGVNHYTFTANVRLVGRPLFLLPIRHHRWMNAINLYVESEFFKGPLTGATFGAPSNPFNRGSEWVPSYGFMFDVTALCMPRKCG
jgi:hypothetical protein